MQLHGLFSILFQVGPCWTLGLSHSIHAPRMGIVTSLLQISSMNIFRVVESWYPIKMQSKIIINNRVSNKDICCLSSIGSPGEQKQFFDIVLMCHLCDFDHLSFSFWESSSSFRQHSASSLAMWALPEHNCFVVWVKLQTFTWFLIARNNLLGWGQLDYETSFLTQVATSEQAALVHKFSFISPSIHLELSDFLRQRGEHISLCKHSPPACNHHCFSNKLGSSWSREPILFSASPLYFQSTKSAAINLGFPCNDPLPLNESE